MEPAMNPERDPGGNSPSGEALPGGSTISLSAIVLAAPIPKFVIDQDHRVILWNRALEVISGLRAEQVIGTRDHWRAFYPEERPCLADILVDGDLERLMDRFPGKFRRSAIVEGAYEVTDHFPFLGKDGRWLHLTAAPILDSTGKRIGAVETLEDISAIVRMQQELAESQERYSSLFSHSYSVSLLIDPESGRIVDANDAAMRYYGFSRDQLISMGIYDLNRLPRAKVVRNLRRAKDEKEKHLFSTHYLADGSKRFVEIYSGPIRVQGKPLFYSIIHDITDRKLAEQALVESEDRYSSLFSNSYTASLLIDPDSGRIVDANDAAMRYYGFSRDQLTSMGIYDLNRHPRETVVQNLRWAKRRKERHFFSTHYLADGSRRFVEIYSGPIRVQGKPLFYSIIHDITDRKLAEQALRESEERYRTLIDQLPDYVLVHRNGTILYTNPEAERLGYRSEDLVGKSIFPLIEPAHIDRVRRAMTMRLTGEIVPPYEITLVARNGTRHTVLVHGSQIQYDGAPASLNVLSDITTIKVAEETIRKANEMLEKRVAERTEELSRANVQLVAEIAARKNAEQEITRSLEEKVLLLREIHHRVKNNLQIVASLLKLQSHYISDPKVLESIRESQSRVRAMALVHERIYRSSNLSEINLRDYLNFLARQIFQFYNAPQYQDLFRLEMADLMVDINRAIPIGLIINELVSNTLKHAYPEGAGGSITITGTRNEDGEIRLVYQDAGRGMPPEFDWRNTESLGLRLVNNLVDQLDGTIEMGRGPGTTFSITIRKRHEPPET